MDIVMGVNTLISCQRWREFAEACELDYPGSFWKDCAHIFAPDRRSANVLARKKGDELAVAAYKFRRKLVRIFWSMSEADRPIPIRPKASSKVCQTGGNFSMNTSTELQIPNGIWMGGRIELTKPLYNALGEMIDSDKPQGLVTASDSIQFWLNPAAVELFQLPSLEAAVPRDTTRDWLPSDLERKRQMIRDAGERAFEIEYTSLVGDGTWKRLVNSYRLIDNRYLIGMNISSESVQAPAGVGN